MTIQWQLTKELTDIYNISYGLSGVYLLFFEFKDGTSIPYYVGSSGKCIKARLVYHLRMLLTGQYIVWPEKYLDQFFKYKFPKDSEYQSFFPFNGKDADFYGQYNKIYPDIKNMIDKLRYTYAFEDEMQDPKSVEYSLINQIGIDRLVNKRFERRRMIEEGIVSDLSLIKPNYHSLFT